MGKYAESTTVDVIRSRAGIERILERYGASGFGFVQQGRKALVEFVVNERRIRFILELPDPTDKQWRFTNHKTPRKRTDNQVREAVEQETRRLWRCLHLCIQAKMECIESGIETFDDAFMAHFIMPDGSRFRDHALPAIERATLEGGKPQLMLTGGVE